MKQKTSLLTKYFQAGFLDKSYVTHQGYSQPFSADVRFLVGVKLYEEYSHFISGAKTIRNYDIPKIDGLKSGYVNLSSEHFRRVMRVLSPVFLPVVKAIVFEDKELRPPRVLSERERLYFNEDVKRTLCRALDMIAPFYL